jgi:transposase
MGFCVARRYGLNANLIFKWLRDARFAPGLARGAADTPCFLPVEIVEHARLEEPRPVTAESLLEFELAGGHRLRISGSYDPEALARLLRGLSG